MSKPTSDAHLRKTVEISDVPYHTRNAEEWLADRAAIRALVDRLEKCHRCDAQATRYGDGCNWCDSCDDQDRLLDPDDTYPPRSEHEHAAPLRALLARIRGWDGEG